jgi:hypothetical protein
METHLITLTVMPSGIKHRVVRLKPDVSEEYIASIFRVEE